MHSRVASRVIPAGVGVVRRHVRHPQAALASSGAQLAVGLAIWDAVRVVVPVERRQHHADGVVVAVVIGAGWAEGETAVENKSEVANG